MNISGRVVPLIASLNLAQLPVAMQALLAETVPGETLRRAYALNAVAQELIYVLGPLWVMLWIAVSGPAAALLSCGVVGSVGVLTTVVLVPPVRRRERAVIGEQTHTPPPPRT